MLHSTIKEDEGMRELTDAQKAEYFRRSYTSVDGLWFMKTEELHSFEEALKIDHKVWSIFPKIQARTLMKMLNAEKGIAGLGRCLAAKHSMERFRFEIETALPSGVTKRIVSAFCRTRLIGMSSAWASINIIGRFSILFLPR